MARGRVRLSVAAARALAETALGRIGYEADAARIIADHVIDAALCGYEYSGLPKILNIAEAPRFRLPRQAMSVLHETELSTAFDGGNNVGMLALYHATLAAIAKAQHRGIALVSLTNSWMSGRSAHFVEMIAASRSRRHPHREQPRAPWRRSAAPSRRSAPTPSRSAADRAGAAGLRHGHLRLHDDRIAMLRERRGEAFPDGVALDAAARRRSIPPQQRSAPCCRSAGTRGSASA